MKKDKLAGLDPAEMRVKLKEIQDESFQLGFRMSMGQTEGLKKLRAMRKDKARLLTYLRAHELQGRAVQGAK
jgi:large subunit ribosomal protein L29